MSLVFMELVALWMNSNSVAIFSGISLFVGASAGTAYHTLKKGSMKTQIAILYTFVAMVGGFIMAIISLKVFSTQPPESYAFWVAAGFVGFKVAEKYQTKAKDTDTDIEDIVK